MDNAALRFSWSPLRLNVFLFIGHCPLLFNFVAMYVCVCVCVWLLVFFLFCFCGNFLIYIIPTSPLLVLCVTNSFFHFWLIGLSWHFYLVRFICHVLYSCVFYVLFKKSFVTNHKELLIIGNWGLLGDGDGVTGWWPLRRTCAIMSAECYIRLINHWSLPLNPIIHYMLI